jgi:hypothetical protein
MLRKAKSAMNRPVHGAFGFSGPFCQKKVPIE